MSPLELVDRPAAARLNPTPKPAPAAEVVVLKFGSSVLRGVEDAPRVASEIYRHVREGRRVVAVVSALAGETDRRLAEARSLGLAHDNDLLPAYVLGGEEKAAGLLAIACDRIGLDVDSLGVRELGLKAVGAAEHARPVGVEGGRLAEALARHEVVIAPGFGAVRPCGRLALLGRGGTDLTAVVIASALGLDHVRLVKDVDGLFDRDPNGADPAALRFEACDWATARRVGGKLVQVDALELAESEGLEIVVSALGSSGGTRIGARLEAPTAPLDRRPVRVAIAGCGVVGGGLYARLAADPRFEVVGVLVRDPKRPRDVAVDPAQLTTSADDLLAREPEIVLEALSDGRAGHDLIVKALERGLSVASANKQAISLDPAGLQALAERFGGRLAYSAAVGGGVAMIETLRKAREAGPIAGFEAVLNGTVNFMLERLDQGAPFDQALAEARAAGFAEEDPSADLEGHDSAAKVRLLAYEAFGRLPEQLPLDALNAASPPRETGVRQIGACRSIAGSLDAEVRLKPVEEPLFLALRGERNALRVVGADGRVWTCKGRGAGRHATCESVLADLHDLV
ncbi:MAG: homoserine dehydrogenase [Brevundimonas sp.]